MIIIIMGVSGCGKTTVGRLLAERLGWPFYDGDDFHSPANVDKMREGIPLTDADRAEWLARLAGLLRDGAARGQSAVLACSALKQTYREQLRVDSTVVRFAYLCGDYATIAQRMEQRPHHYMRPALLASQFAALEEPADALTLDITAPPEVLATRIAAEWAE